MKSENEYQVMPVDTEQIVDESGGSFFLGQRGLLHSEEVADGIEIVRLAVLLADLLLDKFVPVVYRERFGRNDKFVPVRFDVIVLGLFHNVQAVKFQTTGDFLLAFEDGQRNCKQMKIINKNSLLKTNGKFYLSGDSKQ